MLYICKALILQLLSSLLDVYACEIIATDINWKQHLLHLRLLFLLFSILDLDISWFFSANILPLGLSF